MNYHHKPDPLQDADTGKDAIMGAVGLALIILTIALFLVCLVT